MLIRFVINTVIYESISPKLNDQKKSENKKQQKFTKFIDFDAMNYWLCTELNGPSKILAQFQCLIALNDKCFARILFSVWLVC